MHIRARQRYQLLPIFTHFTHTLRSVSKAGKMVQCSRALFLLQSARFIFPASQFVSSFLENFTPSSDLHRHKVCWWWTYRHARKQWCTKNKIKNSLKKSSFSVWFYDCNLRLDFSPLKRKCDFKLLSMVNTAKLFKPTKSYKKSVIGCHLEPRDMFLRISLTHFQVLTSTRLKSPSIILKLHVYYMLILEISSVGLHKRK